MDTFPEYKTKVVAFDFFDTVVHRDVAPEGILFEWAKNVSASLKADVSAKFLYDTRKNVEIKAKAEQGLEELDYDVMISRVFNQLGNLNESLDEFLGLCKKTEIEAEKRHVYLDKKIVKAFDNAVRNQQRIIVISDFYAGKFLIDSICVHLGIRRYIAEIYVSADLNCRKSSGTLYKRVCDVEGISYADISMTGDNKDSDVLIPQKLGILSYFKPYTVNNKTFTKKELLKETGSLSFANPEKALNGYVPELLLFVSRLHKMLLTAKASEALFCSREGQLLKKFFDEYQKNFDNNHKVDTKYFYVSRASTFVASLGPIDTEMFLGIQRQKNHISIAGFLKMVGISSEQVQPICNEIGLSEEYVLNLPLSNSDRRLLSSSSKFVRIYDKTRTNESQLFQKYLLETTKSKQISLVDIGWSGSIQDNIAKILGNSYEVKGFYLGLIVNETTLNLENKAGILFTNYPKKSVGFKQLSYKYTDFERALNADHGPVIGYERRDGGVVPIIQNNLNELELHNRLLEVQREMEIAFDHVLAMFTASVFTPLDLQKGLMKLSLARALRFSPKNWQFSRWENELDVENFMVKEMYEAEALPKKWHVWQKLKAQSPIFETEAVYKLFGDKMSVVANTYSYLMLCIKSIGIKS